MAKQRPVALVTGGARRVGAEIVRRLHGAGFDVAIHYRRARAEAEALQAELDAKRNGGTWLLQADLADVKQASELITWTVGHFGRLDGLVNNASAFHPTPVGKATAADWDDLFAANARAPFFLSQAAAPALRDAAGAIVNLVDIYAERPLARHTIYCMAKAALVMMTRSLARELGPRVRVNAVAPGVVLWPEEGKPPHEQRQLIETTALGRPGAAADVAEAVRWLLQDAKYTTGTVVTVDGGRSLHL